MKIEHHLAQNTQFIIERGVGASIRSTDPASPGRIIKNGSALMREIMQKTSKDDLVTLIVNLWSEYDSLADKSGDKPEIVDRDFKAGPLMRSFEVPDVNNAEIITISICCDAIDQCIESATAPLSNSPTTVGRRIAMYLGDRYGVQS